jgi:hypothetical protein
LGSAAPEGKEMKLKRGNAYVRSVFDLLGETENDMTFSLGWVLGISNCFLSRLLEDITGKSWAGVDDATVRLQTGRVGHGITDVEIELGSDLAIIIEAKRGPDLPSEEQLSRYAHALNIDFTAKKKYLVALTNATPGYASFALTPTIEGIPVLHRPWREMRRLAIASSVHENNANKAWLRSFIGYLVLQRYSSSGVRCWREIRAARLRRW